MRLYQEYDKPYMTNTTLNQPATIDTAIGTAIDTAIMAAGPTEPQSETEAVFHGVPITYIDPFDAELNHTLNSRSGALGDEGRKELAQLAESIRTRGLMHPVIVYMKDPDPSAHLGAPAYAVILGNRRCAACQLIAKDNPLYRMPVRVIDRALLADKDIFVANATENINRRALTPAEEIQTVMRLIDEFGMAQKEVAQELNKKVQWISFCITVGKGIQGDDGIPDARILELMHTEGLGVKPVLEIVRSARLQKSGIDWIRAQCERYVDKRNGVPAVRMRGGGDTSAPVADAVGTDVSRSGNTEDVDPDSAKPIKTGGRPMQQYKSLTASQLRAGLESIVLADDGQTRNTGGVATIAGIFLDFYLGKIKTVERLRSKLIATGYLQD